MKFKATSLQVFCEKLRRLSLVINETTIVINVSHTRPGRDRRKLLNSANRRYFVAAKLQNNWCGYYDKAIYFGATGCKTGAWIIRLIMWQLPSVKPAIGITPVKQLVITVTRRAF